LGSPHREANFAYPEESVSWTKTRSEIAHTKRRDPSADVTELRRQLKAERLEDYIRRTVDDAPALSPEQRDKLALLLRGGSAA
jgi:hypothetical protein